jgi:hypothetical protein
MTETVSFKTVAEVQDYFVEHSLGTWAQTAAQAILDLRLPRPMMVGAALRCVVLNDEAALVAILASPESAEDVRTAMNLLWATREF